MSAKIGASAIAAGLPATSTAGQALHHRAFVCCSLRVCTCSFVLNTVVTSWLQPVDLPPAATPLCMADLCGCSLQVCHLQPQCPRFWAQNLRPWKPAVSTGAVAPHLHLAKTSVAVLHTRAPCLVEPSSPSSLPATPPGAAGRAVVAAGAGRISAVEGVAAYRLGAEAGSAATLKADGGVHLSW